MIGDCGKCVWLMFMLQQGRLKLLNLHVVCFFDLFSLFDVTSKCFHRLNKSLYHAFKRKRKKIKGKKKKRRVNMEETKSETNFKRSMRREVKQG